MRGFEFDQLKTFAAVAGAGSLSAAAPLLHLSQSTISEQVRKLEDRAGVPLFTRSKRGVALTSAGTRLLDHARRIVALNEAAFDDLHGQSIKGELRLAITEYFRTNEVASLLVRLRDAYPQLRLHVSTMKSAEIEAAYASRQIDLGVVMHLSAGSFRPAAHGADARWTLRREPLHWVACAALADQLPDPLPLVLLPGDCMMHQVAIKSLVDHGIPYALVHSASGVAGLQSMLTAGLGVGCLCPSAMGAGITRLGPKHRLPTLPDAVFSLTPPQADERDTVRQARDMLAQQLLM